MRTKSCSPPSKEVRSEKLWLCTTNISLCTNLYIPLHLRFKGVEEKRQSRGSECAIVLVCIWTRAHGGHLGICVLEWFCISAPLDQCKSLSLKK